jgi:CHAD domain-containing protein
LGRRVGEARDWSVFCDAQLPRVFAGPDMPDWGGLIGDTAQTKRDEAFVRAAEAAAAPNFTALALSIAAWSEEAGREPRLLGDSRLDQAIERLAPDLIERLMRKASKRGQKAADGDPAALHAFRKALKKLRYGLEFLDGVYAVPGKMQKRIKNLLKRLGDLNDTATAAHLAETLSQEHVELGPAAVAFALRREREWTDGLPRVERLARKMRRALDT